LGMVLVTPESRAEECMRVLESAGEQALRVGRLVKKGNEGVVLHGLEAWD